MAKTTLYSKFPLETVVRRPGVENNIQRVTIDMTGWANGAHDDISRSSEGIYPYTFEFNDANMNRHTFYTDNMKSSGLKDTLLTMKKEFGATLMPHTEVVVLCPQDCLVDYDKGTNVPFGCTEKFRISDLAEYGMDVLGFDVTEKGVCEARLESVLDETLHKAVINQLRNPIHRQASFPNSVYDYDTIDKRYTAALEEALKNCPLTISGHQDGSWRPWGGEVPAEYGE